MTSEKKKTFARGLHSLTRTCIFFQVALNILFWRVQFLGAFLNVSLGKCPMCISQKTDLLAKNDSLPIAHLFEWKTANIACVFSRIYSLHQCLLLKSTVHQFVSHGFSCERKNHEPIALYCCNDEKKKTNPAESCTMSIVWWLEMDCSWSCIFLMIGRPSKLFPVLRFRVNLFDFCTFHGNLPSFWNSSFRKDNRDGIVPLSQGGNQFSTHQLHSVFCKGLCSHAQEQCISKCFLRNYFAFFLTRYTPLQGILFEGMPHFLCWRGWYNL